MRTEFPNQIFGHFDVRGKSEAGTIRLEGRNSELEIFSDQFLFLDDDQHVAVRGIARDGERITACHCIGAGVGGSHYYHGVERRVLRCFPHYVALGPDHVSPTLREISHVSYSFPRAIDLFYDLGIAGEVFRSHSADEIIAQEQSNLGRNREDQRTIIYSQLFYWSDRGPIVDVKEAGVRVRAFNAPTSRMPSPRGINLKNDVQIRIDFDEPVDLREAIDRIYRVQAFFDTAMQSKQSIGLFSIIRNPETTEQKETKVYISHGQGANVDDLDFREIFSLGRA